MSLAVNKAFTTNSFDLDGRIGSDDPAETGDRHLCSPVISQEVTKCDFNQY
jgi:hypothetical protein